MENIRKGAVVLKTAPTSVDMGLINAQAIRELKAEEVFTFRIAAADDQVDRDYENFSTDCLEKMAALYVGKTVITDHNWSSSRQMARVYAGAVERDGAVSRLILSCYMLRSEANQPTIDAIEAGIIREVSVAAAVRSAVCSICGTDKSAGSCIHRPGKSYEGTLCTVELRDPADVYEVSFVAVPAQQKAGVVKSYAGDVEDPPAGQLGEDYAARLKRITAILELEKAKFFEEESV